MISLYEVFVKLMNQNQFVTSQMITPHKIWIAVSTATIIIKSQITVVNIFRLNC